MIVLSCFKCVHVKVETLDKCSKLFHLIYWVKFNDLNRSDLFIYMWTIASSSTEEKYGTQYVFLWQFVADILILHRYCVISVSDIAKFCRYCVPTVCPDISWLSIRIKMILLLKNIKISYHIQTVLIRIFV